MALSQDEQAIFDRLKRCLDFDREPLCVFDAYYEGVQRVEQLGLAVPPSLQKFWTVVNWPRVTVDALEERIDLEGFRLPNEDDRDSDLWRVWQANGLDEESQLAHLDALIFGQSFLCVGANAADRDTPFVTVESPLEVVCERDPRTRQVSGALRFYKTPHRPAELPKEEYATLYLPNVTVWLEKNNATSQRWVEVDRDVHLLGMVPVVPLTNRPRTARRHGVSEMSDVIPLTDAAARALTNAQLATETLAAPQRVVLGASESDFKDAATGQMKTKWETYFSSVWALTSEAAKIDQFAAADLKNFTTIVEHYAGLVSSVAGLPVRYFGQNTANPPSEGSINADESRLVKRAERRERAWGGSWELAMRLVRRIQEGEWNPELASMETMWRDPSTPTRAQTADAVVKEASTTIGGVPILPLEMAREELGWSATKRARARMLDEEAKNDPLTQRLLQTLPTQQQTSAPNDAAIG